MTEGERFVSAFARKSTFHDPNKRRSYELTRRVAARLIDDPSLVANGRAYLERLIRADPGQARDYALRVDLLGRDIRQMVSQMPEDSPRGDLLRERQPVFVVVAPHERMGMDRPAGLRIDDALGPDPSP